MKDHIIIIGGGVMGSSTAYHLRKIGYDGKITVFEKDPVYEYSSTPRSAGGIRQLFTTAINIKLSRYSLQQYKKFPEMMKINGDPAEIDFRQRGYLFLATEEMLPAIEKQKKLQNEMGVPSQFLAPEELLSVIPELNIKDLAGGLFCSEDGYLDPYSVMQAYKHQARESGVDYISEEVDTILYEQDRITGVRTINGDRHEADIVINCAGAWGPELSEKIGLSVPVVALKRQVFMFDTSIPLQKPLPLTVDTSGVYFRHEGDRVITGYSDKVKPGYDFNWKRSYFDELWPILAHRVANFESLKLESGWAGLYDHNTKDQNAIIGGHPDMKGYYMALGFSGHGMQQAPGVGLGLAELIVKGQYETLDLTPLRFERFAENDLVLEQAIV